MATYIPFYAGQKATAERVGERLVREIMPWTAFTNLGTFATNFSPAGNTPMMRKIEIMGMERWEYKGRISVAASALGAGVDTTMFTFSSSDHKPTSEHGWSVCGAGSLFYPVRVTLQVAGTLKGGVPTAATAATNAVLLDNMYIDEPI